MRICSILSLKNEANMTGRLLPGGGDIGRGEDLFL